MSQYPAARFLTSAAEPRQFVADRGCEVAFAGRSNAGKSSAINAILGRRAIARTSKSPGRTQLVNFFLLRDEQRLVDLPGYGYARVSRAMREHWRALLQAYFEKRRSLAGLILVVDSRRGLGDFDAQMLSWAQALGCPVHVLLTKADKLSREEAQRTLAAAKRALRDDASVQLFSATTGLGLEEARARLAALLTDPGQKNASGAEYRGTPEANSTGLG